MDNVTNRKTGFTLVELSIVLVIIGFIIGSVLVGQDLIAAGKIRSQITQLSQMDTAANSFKSKYGGIPGDYNNPASIINGVTGNDPTTHGYGDGDGLIESNSGVPSAGLSGEPVMFFAELTATGNVFNIPLTTTSFAVGAPWTVSTAFPPSPLGNGVYIGIESDGVANNYYYISQFSGANICCGYPPNHSYGLTVAQALALDSKLDDGFPNSGNVLAAYQNISLAVPGNPANGYPGGINPAFGTPGCIDTNPTPNVYYAGGLNKVVCSLAIKVGF